MQSAALLVKAVVLWCCCEVERRSPRLGASHVGRSRVWRLNLLRALLQVEAEEAWGHGEVPKARFCLLLQPWPVPWRAQRVRLPLSRCL